MRLAYGGTLTAASFESSGDDQRMKVNVIEVKDYLTKSNLPASDYVINPYIGCSHACKYCYACFMKRFTGHTEEWGTFLDVKVCKKPINLKRLVNKNVILSSVTDCYNMYEEKYRVTRDIIEQLVDADCSVGIATKSKLVLRDIDLLKKFKDLKVAMSINTLDEKFRKDMDHASSIADRIATLKELHHQGIYTVLFISPIFPYITDFISIIEATNEFVEEYWFENLNLRGSYKKVILDYVFEKYPEYASAYQAIYVKGQKDYWEALALEIEDYCREKGIKYINYFYHEQLVKEKIEKNKFS